MNHLKAIAIKTVVILLIVWVVMSLLADVATRDSIIAGLITTAALYLMGDMLVLRKFGNIVATIVDAGTAFLILWLYLSSMDYNDVLLWSFISAALIGVFEYMFHQWLLREHIIPDERRMP